MTKKQIYQVAALTVTIITIMAIAICVVYLPPATPFVALFGGAVISWAVGSALSTISGGIVEQVATDHTPEAGNIVSPSKHDHHVHTMIFRTHVKEFDIRGQEMTKDTSLEETDESPRTPKP